MADDSVTPIQSCLDRLRAGDPSARDELIRVSQEQVRLIVRRKMARCRTLRRWTESDDVLQEALIRLDHALKALPIDSTRDYLRLAAYHIRLVLIDLARHYFGPEGMAANQVSPNADEGKPAPAGPTGATSDDPAKWLAWVELHERIAELPEEEREVVELLWYHGMEQKEAAAFLGIAVRTIRRRWAGAKISLGSRLPDDLLK